MKLILKFMLIVVLLSAVSLSSSCRFIDDNFGINTTTEDEAEEISEMWLIAWIAAVASVRVPKFPTYVFDTYRCVDSGVPDCTQYNFSGATTATVNSVGSVCTGAGNNWAIGTCALASYPTCNYNGPASTGTYAVYDCI